MTKVEQLIYEDGLADGKTAGRVEGRAEGRAEGERRLGSLTLSLLSEKRYQDLERVSKDSGYREKLYQKYGI